MAVSFTPFSPKTTLIVGSLGSVRRPSFLGSCTLSTGDLNHHKAESSAHSSGLTAPDGFPSQSKIKVLPMVVFKALHGCLCLPLPLFCLCWFFFCPFARLFAAGSEPLDLTAFFQILLFLVYQLGLFFFFFLCQT